MASPSIANILQTAFLENFSQSLNLDAPELSFLKSVPEKLPNNGRTIKSLIQTQLNPASVGVSARGEVNFLPGQSCSYEEVDIYMKRWRQTVKVEAELEKLCAAGDNSYLKPLEVELSSSLAALNRLRAIWMYGDGTGVLGVVASGGLAESTIGADGKITVTIESSSSLRGYIGWIQVGDHLRFAAADGTIRTPGTVTGGTFHAYKVLSVDTVNNSFVAQMITSADATGPVSAGGSQIVATDNIYHYAQYEAAGSTLPNLNSISDYDTISVVPMGLRGLIMATGTYAGINRANVPNLQGNILDQSTTLVSPTMLMRAVRKVGKRVGRERFIFKNIICSDEVEISLFEQREGNKMGTFAPSSQSGGGEAWEFQFGRHQFRVNSFEFCPRSDIFMIPEFKSPAEQDSRVLMCHHSEPEQVGDVSLSPGTFNYKSSFLRFYQGWHQVSSAVPAALVRLTNFTTGQSNL
jgi:hypothetical protein